MNQPHSSSTYLTENTIFSLVRSMRSAWPLFIICTLISSVTAILEIALFYYLSSLVDVVERQAVDSDKLGPTHAILAGVITANIIALFIRERLTYVSVMTPLANRIRKIFIHTVLQKPLNFFMQWSPTTLSSQITQAGLAGRSMIIDAVNLFVFFAVKVTATAYLFLLIDPWFLLPVLMWAIFCMLVIVGCVGDIREGAKAGALSSSRLTSKLSELIANVTALQIYARSMKMHSSLTVEFSSNEFKTRNQMLYVAKALSLIHYTNTAFISSTALMIAFVFSGTGKSADLTLIATLTASLTGISVSLLMQYNNFVTNIGQLQSTINTIGSVKAEPIEKDDRRVSGANDAQKINPIHILLQNIEIINDGRVTLDIDKLEIYRGEWVAVVGPSGSGKSSLVGLILGLLTPNRGVVVLDGYDISTETPRDYLKNVSYVSQGDKLLTVSIRENLIFDRNDVSDAQIWSILKALSLEKIVKDQSNVSGRSGLDVLFGEDSLGFSGGETQRLCIARALLKQHTLLLMDEPTSALDPGSERRVFDVVTKFSKSRTLLFTSHSTTALSLMDRIIVVKDGRLNDQGSLDELLDRNDYVQKMFQDEVSKHRSSKYQCESYHEGTTLA